MSPRNASSHTIVVAVLAVIAAACSGTAAPASATAVSSTPTPTSGEAADRSESLVQPESGLVFTACRSFETPLTLTDAPGPAGIAARRSDLALLLTEAGPNVHATYAAQAGAADDIALLNNATSRLYGKPVIAHDAESQTTYAVAGLRLGDDTHTVYAHTRLDEAGAGWSPTRVLSDGVIYEPAALLFGESPVLLLRDEADNMHAQRLDADGTASSGVAALGVAADFWTALEAFGRHWLFWTRDTTAYLAIFDSLDLTLGTPMEFIVDVNFRNGISATTLSTSAFLFTWVEDVEGHGLRGYFAHVSQDGELTKQRILGSTSSQLSEARATAYGPIPAISYLERIPTDSIDRIGVQLFTNGGDPLFEPETLFNAEGQVISELNLIAHDELWGAVTWHNALSSEGYLQRFLCTESL